MPITTVTLSIRGVDHSSSFVEALTAVHQAESKTVFWYPFTHAVQNAGYRVS
jgi:hypothetical protein